MRGAGSIAGRGFRPPAKTPKRGIELTDIATNFPNVSELETAPVLQPINDEWSISDPFEPVDPRDCAKYPASPYCENDLFRYGPPVGFAYEIKINNCTTCLYIYPVVGWMRLTPTIVCRRDPNCKEDEDQSGKDQLDKIGRPPRLNENVQPDAYKSPECAFRESQINRYYNYLNDENYKKLQFLSQSESPILTVTGVDTGQKRQRKNIEFKKKPFSVKQRSFTTYTEEENESGCFDDLSFPFPLFNQEGKTVFGQSVFGKFGDIVKGSFVGITYEERTISANGIVIENWRNESALAFFSYRIYVCCGMPKRPSIKPPPPSPPPFGRDDDRQKKKKKGGDDMCCNECRDSKENTDKLLKEIEAIKKALGTGKYEKEAKKKDDSVTGLLNQLSKRMGLESYPIEVPEALLQGQGDKVIKLQSNAEFLYWIVTQFDGLVGQFPIDIEVKDIDPLKAGDQTKKITLPNIAEAIAEIYGLTIKSSVNQEVELNMLLRLAAEVIATKNASVVTQDYARANANFLGYKANYKPRELQYNFDFSSVNLDPRSRKPLVLEDLLKTVTGYVQGWQLEDKETVVGFLQKLMFSAGIIKAVFFRGKGNQKELNRELKSMADAGKAQDEKFEAFIKEINDPNSKFNKGASDKPEIKDETPPEKPKGAK